MPKPTPLTPQQERFCQEYAVDYNGTNAAKRAGYSESTAASQASRLLKNAKVLSRVRAIQKEQLEKTALTKESVLLNLMDVYDRCMQKKPVTEWDYEAGEYKETRALTPLIQKARCIGISPLTIMRD